MSETLPNEVDLRPHLPDVRDQGPRGTCLAFAVTATHEVARIGGAPVPADLSTEVLYWRCKQVDGDYVPGTSFTSATAALQHSGQPLEKLWPYDVGRLDTDASYQPPPAAIERANCQRATLRRIDARVDEIKQCLANGRAVALGLRITYGFHHSTDGHVAVPQPGESLLDGHAFLVVGYQESAVGSGVLIIRNSWGEGWGDGGYGYLPYGYLQGQSPEAWVIERVE